MTIGEYLKKAQTELTNNSVPTARLDSLVLLENTLSCDKAKILANLNSSLLPNQKNVLDRSIKLRAKHVPISQIIHKTEFYGRSFFINKDVLEPRPESETMIDVLKEILLHQGSFSNQKKVSVADIGTGSGALGITAFLEDPKVTIDLLDIDYRALKVAKINVALYTIEANVVKADLLPKVNPKYDILLCNLPYVPDNFKINLAASHEPKIAIFGGQDGLDIYRKLFKLLTYKQHKPLYILAESLPPSHQKLSLIANQSGYQLTKTDDFIQLYRLYA